jgi:hypothetical protein
MWFLKDIFIFFFLKCRCFLYSRKYSTSAEYNLRMAVFGVVTLCILVGIDQSDHPDDGGSKLL